MEKEIQAITLDLTSDVIKANVILEKNMNNKTTSIGGKVDSVRESLRNLIMTENVLAKFKTLTGQDKIIENNEEVKID